MTIYKRCLPCSDTPIGSYVWLQYFSRPGAFKASHTYEDLHLAVGWTACLIAGGISLYGWYVPFVKSKPWIMLGVIACVITRSAASKACLFQLLAHRYALLSSVLWLHQNYIVKDTVFQGKRKTVSGRVSLSLTPIVMLLRFCSDRNANSQHSIKASHETSSRPTFTAVTQVRAFGEWREERVRNSRGHSDTRVWRGV